MLALEPRLPGVEKDARRDSMYMGKPIVNRGTKTPTVPGRSAPHTRARGRAEHGDVIEPLALQATQDEVGERGMRQHCKHKPDGGC